MSIDPDSPRRLGLPGTDWCGSCSRKKGCDQLEYVDGPRLTPTRLMGGEMGEKCHCYDPASATTADTVEHPGQRDLFDVF